MPEPTTLERFYDSEPPPFAIDYLGTENANDEPSILFEQRRSRCYELAGYAVAFGTASVVPGVALVHGSWTGPVPKERIGHAWVKLPARGDVPALVWEPIRHRVYTADAFYEWTKAWDEREYSLTLARRLIHEHQHFGRWHVYRYP